MLKDQLTLLANYNRWMNERLYQQAAILSVEEFRSDRGAFFGSVCGTLNHLAVADTIWLKRFAAHKKYPELSAIDALACPDALDGILYEDIQSLQGYRVELDKIILAWITALTDNDLAATLCYTTTKGVVKQKLLGSVLLHFFNHQTHHRGQITTLLSQSGRDPGVTDLLALIPDQS